MRLNTRLIVLLAFFSVSLGAIAKPLKNLSPVVVKTSAGQVIFQPSTQCDATDCRRYTAQALNKVEAAAGVVIVKAIENGETRYLLVHRASGTITDLLGVPSFSKDASFLIATSFDEKYGSEQTNGTFVWHLFAPDQQPRLLAHIPVTVLSRSELERWVSPNCVAVRGYSNWGISTPSQISRIALKISTTHVVDTKNLSQSTGKVTLQETCD
jgi:hypothetical protein